eukprot:Skav212833  [mRNA]  locus=scaffold2466:206547:207182:+ [translate_table: standard]
MASRHVRKTHLKPEEGVKQLVKRSVETVRKRSSFEPVEGHCPEELQCIIQPIKDKMLSMKQKVMTEDDTIKETLKALDEDKLKVLKRVFGNEDEYGNKRSSTKTITEDKLIQTAPFVMDDLDKIDNYIKHLGSVKEHVLATYTECYARTYNQCNNGLTVNFNNEMFIKDVDGALNYQSILRNIAERQNRNGDNNANNALVVNRGTNNCVIC